MIVDTLEDFNYGFWNEMVRKTGYPIEHPPLFITLEEVQKDNLRIHDFESVPQTFDLNSPHPHFRPFLSSVTYFLAFHTRLVVAQSPNARPKKKPTDAVPPPAWDRSAATRARTLICEFPTDPAFKGVFGRYNGMTKVDGSGTISKPGIDFAHQESERLRITQASSEYITAVQNGVFVPTSSATPFTKVTLSWNADWKQEYKSRISGALKTGNNPSETFEEFLILLDTLKATSKRNSNQGAHRFLHPRCRGRRKRPKTAADNTGDEEEDLFDDDLLVESDFEEETPPQHASAARFPVPASQNIQQLVDTVAKQQVLLDNVLQSQGTSQVSQDTRVFNLKDLREEFQKESERTVSAEMITLMSSMALCISTMELIHIAANPNITEEQRKPLSLHYDMMINQVENVFKWSFDQKHAFYTALSAIPVFKNARDALKRPL